MSIKTVSVEANQLDGYKIQAKSRQHISLIDQPPSAGGSDAGPTPLDYLFISLAGCVVTIGHMIARQKRLPVKDIKVRIEGDLDTDVLLGKSTSARPGFTDIRVFVNIEAEMSKAEKEQYLREIDARCPISDNILHLTPIQFIVE